MSAAPKFIRTPKGKRITVPQYMALQRAQSARTRGGGPACEHGHFDCAAWDGGPCEAELASGIEIDEAVIGHECAACETMFATADALTAHQCTAKVQV